MSTPITLSSSPMSPIVAKKKPSVAASLRRWRDCWVGFWERRRPFPSQRASAEFLAYYAGLYQERGPNPTEFGVVLRRNGRPFLANPFPESEAVHYLYHPDGLVMADLESVLDGLATQWNTPPVDNPNPQDDAAQYSWPTIDEADHARQLDQRETEKDWALTAGVCWGMVLLEAGNLEWLRERVHPDNLAWATVQALRKSPWADWGVDPKKVLAAAVDKDVVPKTVADGLFPEWQEHARGIHGS